MISAELLRYGMNSPGVSPWPGGYPFLVLQLHVNRSASGELGASAWLLLRVGGVPPYAIKHCFQKA